MDQGKIVLILGPMFANKSTELLLYAKKKYYSQKRVIMVKHKSDNAKKNNSLTHNGWDFENIIYKDKLNIEDFYEYDIICIDEGQFFDDIYQFCKDALSNGKEIYISALNGDYKQEPFENISKIIPLCSKIISKHSQCILCGKKAFYTKRKIQDNRQILIGNESYYEPRCYKCLDK